MTEVLFYHLQSQPLERVLPQLLEKTLQKGWRAAVRVGSEERVKALDDALWTYTDESFLPHGVAGEGDAEHPIVIGLAPGTTNRDVLFLVDGALIPEAFEGQRMVLIFDGNDVEAVAEARRAWKDVKAQGHTATYWQQDETGRWVQKA